VGEIDYTDKEVAATEPSRDSHGDPVESAFDFHLVVLATVPPGSGQQPTVLLLVAGTIEVR
jgi:hypothetical protein